MTRSRLAFHVLLLLATVFFSGCIAPKAYVDPRVRTVAYKDIAPSGSPEPATVSASFTTNGKPNKRASDVFEKKLHRVLESTKVFANSSSSPVKLSFTLDNHGDTGEAIGKGVATGMTLGLMGSQVTDFYTLTVKLTRENGGSVQRNYEHALYSTIGLKSPPAGLTPVDFADALDQIVEDLVLKFLKDYQSGDLK